MTAYQTTLLVLHVLSAIVGIGATFTFGVIGPLAGKIGGPGSLALLEANQAISKRLVYPFALAVLPVSGLLMIKAFGFDHAFFSHWWLWLSIVLYVIAAGLATGVLGPGVRKLIALGKDG